MIPEIVLIDANAIGFARQMGGAVMKAGDMETQAVFGFVDYMRELKVKYPYAKIIVVWDGRADWRFCMMPKYKSTRKKNPAMLRQRDAYKEQVPFIKACLTAMGVDQYVPGDYEADDIAGKYVRRLGAKHKILLVTSDQDWLQLVGPTVHWWDFRADQLVTLDTLEDKTGYDCPILFMESKCLTGDGGDDVPGVGGIGKVNAKKMLDRFGGIRAAITYIRDHPEEKWPKAWVALGTPDRLKRLAENRTMMDLRTDHSPPGSKNGKYVKGNYSEGEITATFETLYFNSMLGRLDDWLAPFRR